MINSENIASNQDEYIDTMLGLIQSTKYGSITVTIQDGRIVQIEKNEKIRILNK